MKSLDDEFTKNFLEVRKTVEALSQMLKASAKILPDDITDCANLDEVTEVKFIANKVYDLGCKIADIGEKLMVGTEVEKLWDEKPENCYPDIEAKRNDHGVFARDH